jgi:hypothetical protein
VNPLRRLLRRVAPEAYAVWEIASPGDARLAVRNGVPPSTARDWSRRSAPKVISLDLVDAGEQALRRIVALRRRNARLIAMLRRISATKSPWRTFLKTQLPRVYGAHADDGNRSNSHVANGRTREIYGSFEFLDTTG